MGQPGLTEQGSPQLLLKEATEGILALEPATPHGLGARRREVGNSLLAQPATKETGHAQNNSMDGCQGHCAGEKGTSPEECTLCDLLLSSNEVRPRQKSVMMAVPVGKQRTAYQKGHKGMPHPRALGVGTEHYTGVCTCQNPSGCGFKPCAQ